MNFKKKMIITVLPAIIVSISVMAGIVMYLNYRYMKELAIESAINKAARHAEKIERYFDNYIKLNENYRDLAGDFEKIPIAERRAYYDNISKLFLDRNKDLLAIWLNFFPNKLDNLDEKYRTIRDYYPTGRFLIGWSRSNDIVYKDTERGIEHEEFDTDYYVRPVKEKKTIVTQPYFFSYTGKDEDAAFMTSVSSPVISENGEIVGVAGIDISVEQIGEIINSSRFDNESRAILFSESGNIFFYSDTTYIGLNIREIESCKHIMKRMQNFDQIQNKSITLTDSEDDLEVIIPINVRSGKLAILFSVSISYDKLLFKGRTNMAIIAGGALVALLFLLFVVLIYIRKNGKILSHVYAASEKISNGELDILLPRMGFLEFDDMMVAVERFSNTTKNVLIDIKNIKDSTARGDFDIRLYPDAYNGTHRKLLTIINEILDDFSNPLKILHERILNISNGTIQAYTNIKEIGILCSVENGLTEISSIFSNIVLEADQLAANINSGNLGYRINSSIYQGEYKTLFDNINSTYDTFAKHIGLFNLALEEIVKGPYVSPIVEVVEGDFIIVKNNINRIIDTLNSFLNQIVALVDSVNLGNLDTTILEKDFNDKWKIVLSGINHIYLIFINITDTITKALSDIDTGATTSNTVSDHKFEKERQVSLVENKYKGKLADMLNNLNKFIDKKDNINS